jgi:hypothetical protein
LPDDREDEHKNTALPPNGQTYRGMQTVAPLLARGLAVIVQTVVWDSYLVWLKDLEQENFKYIATYVHGPTHT